MKRLHVIIRGCLHVKFHPVKKSSLSMVKCFSLFTRFCWDEVSFQDELIPVKKTDEISSQDEKRRVNTSSRDEILKWACFFSF